MVTSKLVINETIAEVDAKFGTSLFEVKDNSSRFSKGGVLYNCLAGIQLDGPTKVKSVTKKWKRDGKEFIEFRFVDPYIKSKWKTTTEQEDGLSSYSQPEIPSTTEQRMETSIPPLPEFIPIIPALSPSTPQSMDTTTPTGTLISKDYQDTIATLDELLASLPLHIVKDTFEQAVTDEAIREIDKLLFILQEK